MKSTIERGLTLTEQVYAFARERIVSGHYRAGQVLVESEIAAELSVSRTPVSNAIIMLKERGLLEDRNGKAAVPRLTLKDVVDLYRCRLALDGLAARLAASTITDRDIVRLAGDLRTWSDAPSVGTHTALWVSDLGFHETIYDVSGNRHLLRFAQICTELASVYRQRTVRRDDGSGASAEPVRTEEHARLEHQAILDALRERDALAAEQAARRHIENVIEHLQRSEVTDREPV